MNQSPTFYLDKIEKCIIKYKKYIENESHQWNKDEHILSDQILGMLGFFSVILTSFDTSKDNTLLFIEIQSLCKSIEENC